MIFDNMIGPNRPITWVCEFWPVLVGSFVSSLVATSLCKKIALRFGIVDRPDKLVKTHKFPKVTKLIQLPKSYHNPHTGSVKLMSD